MKLLNIVLHVLQGAFKVDEDAVLKQRIEFHKIITIYPWDIVHFSENLKFESVIYDYGTVESSVMMDFHGRMCVSARVYV